MSIVCKPGLTAVRVCESPTKNIRWYAPSGMYAVLIPGQSLISKYFFHIEDAQAYLRGDKPECLDNVEKSVWGSLE
jgi:hypothetical protein